MAKMSRRRCNGKASWRSESEIMAAAAIMPAAKKSKKQKKTKKMSAAASQQRNTIISRHQQSANSGGGNINGVIGSWQLSGRSDVSAESRRNIINSSNSRANMAARTQQHQLQHRNQRQRKAAGS